MPNDQRRELIKGEIRTMAPAGFEHGSVIVTLTTIINHHVIAHRLGIVAGAETGYVLSTNPDTVRGADVSFVAAARIPKGRLPVKYWPGAPDLAVEVVSPGDTVMEVAEKVDEYLVAGARSVWIVNPKHRTITLHHPGQNPIVLRENDVLVDEQIFPGLSVPVADVFA
jgi:Uma2 family endonuclease